ncbi:MAG: acyl-CoA thioesterase [Lachnospiraceae bacterium]|nr:acyl-CoA thioesterase [Lachnospiraceae bacterium]
MIPYQHKVQYYETDQMGVVHHSNYIRWFEEARTDYMDQMGMGYALMERRGILCPVLRVEADYLRMVHFGDTVTILLDIKEYNGIKLAMAYKVIDNKTEMVHCKGTTKHCFLKEDGKPISLKKECIDFHNMFHKGLEDSVRKIQKGE